MKIEDYYAAGDIIQGIKRLDNSISNIKYIIQTSDATKWTMAVRPNNSHPYTIIDHKGLLLEFLNMTLSNLLKERAELKEKLEEL